ncbi:MAG: CCA tRNA nucleotidyltransferase [Candidatus Acididesulfobacter diazotrophicus]|uniref:CCA tRNA nucleotidyltransferase n=1 Tax=Candidatus Acididesulfobacter diazotrophicus TaxID=2597226 RepID=A0A519BPP7_9DELT|nr:MAG: CCA tRNA nucleotidyltransferase [Candidatus Acididesulfobacter diazotrophicus]
MTAYLDINDLNKNVNNHISNIDFYKTIGKIAKTHGFKIYIIGGFVRDLIIYNIYGIYNISEDKSLDIDICVEGDATIFAEMLKNELHKYNKADFYINNIKIHKQFKTAGILFTIKENNNIDIVNNIEKTDKIDKTDKTINTKINIDFASAREESYFKSGALPLVKFSDLKHDVIRRDFSINTLALDLNPDNFFEIIDYCNGVKDILNKKIRVLHNLSFIDDPTRIFRAVRFEKRLNFKIEKITKNLLLDALSKGVMNNISGKRISNELSLVFKENCPEIYFERLEKLGALKSIDEDLKFTPENKKVFKNIHNFYKLNKEKINNIKVKNGIKIKINFELFYIIELIIKLEEKKIISILERLNFGENIKKLILSVKQETEFIENGAIFDKLNLNANENNIRKNNIKIDNIKNNNNIKEYNHIIKDEMLSNNTNNKALQKSEIYLILKSFNLYSVIFFIVRYNNKCEKNKKDSKKSDNKSNDNKNSCKNCDNNNKYIKEYQDIQDNKYKNIIKYLNTYLFEIININLNISGDELKKMGIKEGPELGEILNKLKLLKIDGIIKNKEEEIEYIKNNYLTNNVNIQ